MKKLVLFILVIQLSSCAELNKFVETMPNPTISNAQISNGLKEALHNGITNQVTTLAKKDGFYKSSVAKILMPKELQKVENTLRSLGLGSVADEGVKMLNRAAEDAVAEAIPIFTDAIKGLTLNDAKNILLGDNNSATKYLQSATNQALYAKFEPIINNSFKKVGADRIWNNLINKYNSLPLTQDVNPDLTNYVTNEALKSVFKMVSKEELNIRTKASSRTSDLLRKVFALQDRK